ncbi:glycosyltransferase family 9 protein [Roseateles sp. DAIF2]|uniref:glycosyltransferase family 9 protein n=1 Tax=Roseateles sp. DAIF2 TaxID=2714952 RepID=UPI0018A27522|nr:glycosyltransferase family 9 protein [Roseateles sp. DAIF2]QPF73666.1 glycosyltransferase family 9 protein [Roseateles sp. DAIF2]
MSIDTRPHTAVQIQLNGMGDLVWHAQYLRCIAEQSRDGQITLIAPPTAMARDLIGHEPWLREVVDFDRRPRRVERRRGRHSGLPGLMRLGAELAPSRFDRMIMFSDHPGRTVIVCWRAGIRQRIGYGATWLQRLMLSKTPWIDFYDGPDVRSYHEATRFAITQGFCDAPIVPRISVRPDAVARMSERLAGLPRPLYALAIGSSEPCKQWGAANFSALATLLIESGGGVFLTGGPLEAELAEEILGGIPAELRGRALAVTDGSAADTVAAMSLATVCIGNDTGATNIAAGVCTPSWVLLGPRPPLPHDPEMLKLLQAPQLADIQPAEVVRQVLASMAAPLATHDPLSRP